MLEAKFEGVRRAHVELEPVGLSRTDSKSGVASSLELGGVDDALVRRVDILFTVGADAHAGGQVADFVAGTIGVGRAGRCVAGALQADAFAAAVVVGVAALGLAGGAIAGLLAAAGLVCTGLACIRLASGALAALAERTVLVCAAGFAALADTLIGAGSAKLVSRTGSVGSDAATGSALADIGTVK
jgi:hypothetical protein